MPDRVDRIVRAIGECKDALGQKLEHVRSESEVRAIAVAALSAAEAETQPVAWYVGADYGSGDTHAEVTMTRLPDGRLRVDGVHTWNPALEIEASPPIRDEEEITATVERELVACLEADGIECDQEGYAWTADVSKRTEIDVTGLAVAIATAIRARGER